VFVSTKEVETDVLVIGSGVAGLFAAIRAKEAGVHTTVVEKGQSGFSGDSAYGAQFISITFPGDDIDKFAKQTIAWSDYLADQDIVYAVVQESYDRFQDLLKWGVEFMRDETGEIRTVVADKPYDTECKTRYVFPSPPCSPNHIGKMKQEALRLGVKFIDRVMVTDLLTSEGRVAGAVGFDTRVGGFYQFNAKAVIIATGTFALPLPSANVLKSGPAGMMMAARAGAELRNMEQGKSFNCGNSPIFTSLGPYYWDESEWWGQKFVNAAGEEFMEQYELAHRLPGRKHWPPPWRMFIPAIVREWREGRGPCYLDLSECENYWERMAGLYDGYLHQFVKEWDYLAKVKGVSSLKEFWKEKFELVPGGGGSEGRGGIRVNADSETSVPGLYAAGISTDTTGGAVYASASSFTACFTQGHRAGINAAEYARSQAEPVIHPEQVETLKQAVYAPLGNERGIEPDDLQARLALTSYRYTDIIKHGARLKEGIAEIDKLREESENLRARDYHYLKKCHNTRDTVALWGIMARTALLRTESRCDHYREDYPFMDNDEWLKWIIVRLVGGEPEMTTEEIPFDKLNWKHRPVPGKIDQWRKR
jgi:succinate dehydrogenase / fumarate reductase, flavoprotein subunit